MNNFKEPYYLVDFNSSICNFEIYINDMPAFVHHSGGSIASHTPVNHFILNSGKQNIKIKVLPLSGENHLREDGFLKIKVFCYDSSTTNYQDTVQTFEYQKEDFAETKFPLIEVYGEFDAEVEYDIPGWKNSHVFDDENPDRDQIIKYFRVIYNAFKTKDIEMIHQEMLPKFQEIDKAMYLGNEDNRKELSGLFEQLENGHFMLQDFPEEPVIKLFGEKRVPYLTGTNQMPAVYYKNEQTNEEFFMPVFICKNGLEYKVIR
ncbi:hypothetical protein VUJ46_09340 [Chryseobacterium sp. MYb264]|uniref:hypothetical protein n=1 Tax=Chryseobacterium sp. MYb264 TaxID=2745153 RepID=UPI002E15D4E8|nr:hypothetical protein VUJ46_09340 [Chryseobacterium sp. MYb264]